VVTRQVLSPSAQVTLFDLIGHRIFQVNWLQLATSAGIRLISRPIKRLLRPGMIPISDPWLMERLKQSEDPWVERKKTPSGDERGIRKMLVAFANSLREGQMAVLFIGASNDGKHPGIRNADELQKKVAGTRVLSVETSLETAQTARERRLVVQTIWLM
jgi:hypothetical protein